MVNDNLAYQVAATPEHEIMIDEAPVKWCTVSLSEIIERGTRHRTILFLGILLLLCFLLQKQHRGLSTISRLESIHMKVYTGNDSMILNKPLSK